MKNQQPLGIIYSLHTCCATKLNYVQMNPHPFPWRRGTRTDRLTELVPQILEFFLPLALLLLQLALQEPKTDTRTDSTLFLITSCMKTMGRHCLLQKFLIPLEIFFYILMQT